MKLLLTTLNSQYIHSAPALRYLYESAGSWREHITLEEFSVNQEETAVYMQIIRGGYDVVCFSSYIWNMTKTLELIRTLKAAQPQLRIVAGGPEASFETRELLEAFPEIDLVIRGEGERLFRKLVEELFSSAGGADFWEEVKKQGRLWGPELLEPEEIPFPYQSREPEEGKIVYYEASRGCPYRCAFCMSPAAGSLRFLPLERVKKELSYFLSRRVPQVKLIDRTFNADPDRAARILEYLVQQDNGVTNFHLELCGDRISQEMMEAFEEARNGLFQLEIGVQSTCPQALSACGRHVDFQALSENVKRLVDLRTIHIHLDLIAGLPYESFQRFGLSFDQVYALKPDDLQLGFLKLIKGSALRRDAARYGYIYRKKEPYEVIANDAISARELVELKQIEHVLGLYYNKPGFRCTLSYLIDHWFSSPFAFYRKFAAWYFDRGYHLCAQPRRRLYDILQQWMDQEGFAPAQGLRELLLYDRLAAEPGSRISEKAYSGFVHQSLHQMFRFEEGIRVKELIKTINYHSFTYNVSDLRYRAARDLEKEEKTLCIFFSDKRDAGGMAAEMCLPVPPEGEQTRSLQTPKQDTGGNHER